MTVILGNHCLQILLPVGPEPAGIVLICLFIVPHIPAFIHHIHSQLIASLQQAAADRVVCRADSIKSKVFHLFYPTVLTVRIASGADYTIIMMDTSAAEFHRAAVDKKSVMTPGHHTDAKTAFRGIAACQYGTAGIQIGMICIPQSGFWDFQRDPVTISGSHNSAAIQNFYRYFSTDMRCLHLNHRRIQRNRFYLDSFR